MSVYVLRSDNLVKIGFTDYLRARYQSIVAMIPVPVEFVGYMPGGREVEAHFHWLFAGSRLSGEWFVETPEMRALFAAILLPTLPDVAAADHDPKRKGSDGDVAKWSALIRERAAFCWPTEKHGDRVNLLRAALGWNLNRVKDLYNADNRISLRAFEEKDIERWLATVAGPDMAEAAKGAAQSKETGFDCEVIEWRYRDHQTGVTVHDRSDDRFLALNTPYRDRRLVEYITSAQEAA